MSELRQTATDYLAIRRALGFKLREHDRLLDGFLTYLEASAATTITVTDVVAWATLPGVSPAVSSKRLSVVRAFARHMRCLDPATQIPPADLVARPAQRRRGYLFSQADIDRLIAVAGGLRPALRAATYQTYFGLLAATGMRKGEAIGLDRGDVDLNAGVVAIRETKFHKHRRLPLHPSTIRALSSYSEARDQLCPKPKGSTFFISERGARLAPSSVDRAFHQMLQAAGLAVQPGAVHHPTIHTLRHNFAVATVRDWHRQGGDPVGKLALLSAYLGHADPAYTYWYLQACPELLALAAQRLERWERGRRQ
jgi:integrase